MELEEFQISLLHALSEIESVGHVDIRTEAFILKGRVLFAGDTFLQIYFNELTGTTAFALVDSGQRIWGPDFDNLRGWHLHPADNPETHVRITPKTIEEIIALLKEILNNDKRQNV